ncbi:MAG: response regulator [Ignavibacteriales bacterium]|nr:response regulator [Ignavibacteriales bacterium]
MTIENHSHNSTSGQAEIKKTILLVEDEIVLSELTKEYLEIHSYHVLTAKDGEEAIELYRKHCDTIDIVVTDMGLPKLTGLEVMIEMKKSNRKQNLFLPAGTSNRN